VGRTTLWVAGERAGGTGQHGSGPLSMKRFWKFVYPFSITQNQD
jgi:hypothetical protein